MARSRLHTIIIAAMAAAATVLAACSSSSPAPPTAKNGGNLVFQFAAAPVDLDATTTQDNAAAMQMMAAWFQQLAAPAAAGGYVPVLASSWNIQPGGLAYTFHIRHGVTFSNGKPLTAADVVYSLRQNMAKKVSVVNFLTGYITSITVPSPMTVQIKLKKPWPNLLADLASPNEDIYPANSFTAKTEAAFFAHHPIGTGPFVLTSEVPGSSYVVTRNPRYWDKAAEPHLDKITFAVDTSDTTRSAAVLGGQADVAESPPPAQVPSLQDNPAVRIRMVTSSLVEIICLNVTKYPLSNQKVRQAISLAINRQAIIKSGLSGYAEVSRTYFVGPAAHTFQDTTANLYPYDLARARQLMRQSGVRTPVTIPLEISTGSAQDAIFTVVRAGLAQIGIHVTPVRSDEASVDSSIIHERYAMATTFFGDLSADPTVQPLFANVPSYCCDAYFTHMHDPALISMTLRASVTSNRATEQRLYDQIQVREAADAFVLPLYFPKLIHVYSARVTGFNVDSFGFYNWAQMGLAG